MSTSTRYFTYAITINRKSNSTAGNRIFFETVSLKAQGLVIVTMAAFEHLELLSLFIFELMPAPPKSKVHLSSSTDDKKPCGLLLNTNNVWDFDKISPFWSLLIEC